MKTNSNPHRSPAGWLALAVAVFSVSTVAPAADRTWSGGGATPNWSDTGNWDTVPVSGDNVIFSGAGQQVNVNDISGLSLGWLWLNNAGYAISGSPITLSNGLTNSFDGNTIGLNLSLTAPQSFSSQSGAINFSGGAGQATTVTNNGNALTFTDAGDINFYGAISGTGSLVMDGTGTLTITNRQPLTGGIVVNSGTMVVSTLNNLNFGGALSPSLVTVNTNGVILGNGTHAIGGGTAVFVNRGDWKLNFEDYKQNLTMWDGTIEPGPTPNSSGGQLRVGLAGGSGTYTWYITNSIIGSTISSPLSTIGSGVNLILDVARGTAASDLTVSGSIISGGNITFVRDGITTLSGANTHSGALTISGGTVKLIGSLWSSPLTVATNAVFDVSGASGFTLNTNQVLAGVGTVIGTVYDNSIDAIGSAINPGGSGIGTLKMDGLNLSGNALSFNFNLSTVTTVGAGVNDLITCTNLTLSGGATNIVNFTLSGTPAAGAYTLITYPLGAGPSAGPVTTLAAAATRSTYAFSSDGTSIKVTVVANPAPLVWRGDGSTNIWDTSTTSNWLNGVSKDVFLTGDNATFNDNGSNTPAINLVGALSANIVTVASTKDYTFAGSGKLTGASKLLKSGSGNLTILTPNDNAGGGGLNGSGTVTVGSGGPAVANIGTGTLTNNTKLTFFENASVTYAGNMSGTGSVTAFMPGATLTMTGSNTFTGGLTVQNGTLQIGNATVSSVVGNITNYGTLNLYRSDAFTNLNNITSAGNTLEYGNGDINVRGVGGMTVDGSASINAMPQGSLSVGQSAYGKLTVNPGAVITLGSGLFIGNPTSTPGDYIQNGGTVTANGNSTRIAHWGSEISTFTMNGGTFNAPNNQLGVGWDGVGLMYMNGGTVNVRTLTVDDGAGATAAISGTNNTLLMTNGTINIGTGGIGGNPANAFIILGGGTIGTTVPAAQILAGWSSAMNMILTNNGPTFDTSNSLITLSGNLSGKGGFTKAGTGYLNLNGTNNTYTNTTTVAAGTLEGTGTNWFSPIVVASGANLSAGAALATGTLTTTNVTVNSGGNLVFDLSSSAATSDLLYIRGALALNSTPLLLNFLGTGVPLTNVSYTIISNLVAPRTGTLVYNNPTRYAATLDQSQPNRVQISFTGTNAALVWQGGVTTSWNVNADANWLNNGVADKYFQSDVVVFDSTGIAKSNVTLAATVTPASVTVNSSGDYTFAGSPIAGVATLTKSGTGKLTLLNSNAYLGATTVAAGTLQVGNGGTTGTLPNGGTVNDYGSLVFNRSDTANFNGTINGPGTLTQSGGGTLLITATQNHYGGSTVNPGSTIQLGNGALADSGSLGNGTVINNGTINFYRLSNVGVATPYTGGGNFNFLGTGGAGQSGYVLNATNTFTGPVTLSLARLQSGFGAQSFGSPSSITVNPGSQAYATATPASSIYNIPLNLAGSGWQDGLGALRMEGAGTWAGNIALTANARIAATTATTNTITGTISGNYELETYGSTAAGAVLLAPSAPNTYNALRVSIGTAGTKTIAGNNNAIPNNIPLTMNGGTLWLNGFSKTFSSFLNLSGSSSIQNGSSTTPASVTLVPTLGTSSYNGTFADGATQPLNVTLNQTPGLWALTLATANPNWTGNLTNNGGIITVGAANILGSQAAFGRSLVFNNAALITTINNVLNGYNGSVVLNNSTWYCLRYSSFAPLAGSLMLTNSTITCTNNTDGSGFLSLGLPSTVLVRGAAPSYLLGTGTGAGYGMAGSGGTTFDVADVTGNANADLIIGPTVRSANNLIKAGAGTLELDGAATLTGSTIINAGTLTLGATGTLPLSPQLKIAAGASLDVTAVPGGLTLINGQTVAGSGTLKGSLFDAANTFIQPGDLGTAGTLTITTNLTLSDSGAVLNFDISNNAGSGNDKIVVGGTLTVASATPTPVNFNFLNGSVAAGSYTLIQAGSIVGTVSTAFTNASRYNATFSQSGNNVVVTFTGSASNLVWSGADPGNAGVWDVATTLNWFDGSAANMFYQNDGVRFDDTSVNTTVTITAPVSPSSITYDSTNNYVLSGSGTFFGTTSITKNNTNTVQVGIPSSAIGPITVNNGILTFNGATVDDTYNGATLITVANGGAFDFGCSFDNARFQPHTFLIAGSGPDGLGAIRCTTCAVSGSANISNITLTANSVFGVEQRWDTSTGTMLGSILNGQGNKLTITGAGGMSIRSQIITNIASVTITNSGVWYENFNQTNAWTATITNYVKPGASIGNFGGVTVNVPIVLDDATIQNQGGTGTPVWTGGIVVSNTATLRNNSVQNFYGVVSGPGVVSVNGGTAALTFSNANSYTGGTVISNAPSTTTAVNATAGTAAVIVSTGGALGSGPLTINGLNFPALSTNTAFFTNNVLRAVEFNLPAPATVANNIVFPSTTITNVGLQCRNSAQVVNLTGLISGGFVNMTNWIDVADGVGGGVVRYANTGNNFVGNSTLFRGTLAITGDGSLGNSANVLRLNTGSQANGLRFDAPNINVAHTVNITASSGLNVYGDNNGDGTPDTVNNATISGSIVSTATGSIVLATGGTNIAGTSFGTLTLSGSNTFNHQLTIDANTKVVSANSNALGLTSFVLLINPGATLALSGGGGFVNRQLNINGSGVLSGGSGVGALENLNGNSIYSGSVPLQSATAIGVTAGSLNISGVISGAFPLTKVGPGPLTLSAANTYNAGTIINGGSLILNGSIPVGNAVTVNPGTTLGGSGTINGPITAFAGSVLQPGAGGSTPGKLTVNSTINLNGNTVMFLNKSTPTNSQIAGLTTVVYGGTLSVTNLGGALAAGDKFTLFSAISRVGSFSVTNLPALTSGLVWSNSLALDGSIQVVATVNTTPTNLVTSISGNVLTISWPTDHTGWRLQSQTNGLGVGLNVNPAAWTPVPGSASVNTMNFTIDPLQPTVFYRLVYP